MRIQIIMISYREQYPVSRPLPTVKRILSEPNALPHIVQLLVTFDPVLVEQVTRFIMYLPS